MQEDLLKALAHAVSHGLEYETSDLVQQLCIAHAQQNGYVKDDAAVAAKIEVAISILADVFEQH